MGRASWSNDLWNVNTQLWEIKFRVTWEVSDYAITLSPGASFLCPCRNMNIWTQFANIERPAPETQHFWGLSCLAWVPAVVSVWLELQCPRALYANKYTFTSWPLSGYNSPGFLGPHCVGAYHFSQDFFAYLVGFLPYTTPYSPLSSLLPQIPAASADPNSDLCLIHAVRLVSSFWLLFLFCDLRSASRQKARLKWLSCVSLLWGSHLSCLLFNACFKYFVSFIVVYIEKLSLITP